MTTSTTAGTEPETEAEPMLPTPLPASKTPAPLRLAARGRLPTPAPVWNPTPAPVVPLAAVAGVAPAIGPAATGVHLTAVALLAIIFGGFGSGAAVMFAARSAGRSPEPRARVADVAPPSAAPLAPTTEVAAAPAVERLPVPVAAPSETAKAPVRAHVARPRRAASVLMTAKATQHHGIEGGAEGETVSPPNPAKGEPQAKAAVEAGSGDFVDPFGQ